jgi:integrase
MPRGRKPAWPPTRHERGGFEYVKLTVGARRREVRLGPVGSAEADQEYARLLAEVAAHGGRPPLKPSADVTCLETVVAHLEARKTRDERNTFNRRKQALRPVVELYGSLPVREFGPVALRAVRGVYLQGGVARSYVNSLTNCVRSWLKWCVAEEHYAPERLAVLRTIDGLREGEGGEEREAREPADPVLVEKTLPHLPWPVGDMVRVQMLTGCRPCEVCRMTPGMIDRDWMTVDGVKLWLYRLPKHKGAWRGKGRRRDIPIGPRAQAVLLPYLLREADKPLFSPLESVRWQRRERGTKGHERKVYKPRSSTRPMRDGYTTGAYDKVIRRTLLRAGLELWTPHQLRHRVGTDVFTEGTEEDAQAVLGHDSPDATRIYAKRLERAARIMARIG